MSTRSHRRLGALLFGVPTVLSFLLALVGLIAGQFMTAAPASAVPVPVLVYQVESTSNGHQASLLNLPIGQPGVLQAPTPVDIDGDLIPDVTVAVNLVNVDGAFLNPPQIGQVLAPNIQINRLITAPLLTPNTPNLKIQVKLTVKDVGGSNPDMNFRFGYDTGPGGSIPQYWKATVAGLDKMFNPIQAVIDTTGQQLGLHPGISDFRLGAIAAPYQGPLSIIAGFDQGTTKADFALNYRPFPNAVQVNYGTDNAGQHITYAHGVDSEVDLTSNLNLTTSTGTTNGVVRIDRLPRAMAIDLNQTATGGSIDYRSRPNSRLPDLQANLVTTTVGKPPLVARADVEQLPAVMHGEWDMNSAAKQAHAKFTASGTGIGAIEARVQNFFTPTKLVPWTPDERQYASFQQVPVGAGNEQLIMGRAERLRNISFDQLGGGYKIHAGIGDGEVPFVGHMGIDQRPTGALIDGFAKISPLPDSMDMSFTPPGTDQAVNPLKVTYDASQSVDLDAHAEIRQATAAVNAVCGAAGTICADFRARSIPAHIEARVRNGLHTPQGQPETRIEVDDIPRPGGIQPDFRANVVLGPQGPGDIAPLVAQAELDGLSRFLRMRTVQGADETLQRLEFHTCDYNYDLATPACAAGTEDEIGAVRVNVRDFLSRPANLPQPVSPAPNFVGVTARGDNANPNLVSFEAVGRMVHIKELQYVNSGGTFGARTQVGGGQNLAVDADVQGVRLPQLPGQRVDLAAHALINPLPSTINLCFQNSGGDLVNGTDPVTKECQQLKPFADTSVTKSPIVFDWHASSGFSVLGSARVHLDKATPANLADDVAAAADIKIDNIPSFLTAKVAVPTGDTSGPVRVLTQGPAGSSINLGLHGEYTVGGASCNDPNPLHDVACADATVTKLPTNLSALIDSAKNDSKIAFYACDYAFYDVSPACKPGTAGEIGVLAVDGHLVKGHPGPLGVLEPTQDLHALLQFRQPSTNDIALRGRARFEKIRSVSYDQDADGFDAAYDLGDGLKPLEMKVQADTRKGTLPDVDGLLAAAELLITNLPSVLKVRQHGPGDGANADPMVLTYDASSPVRVQAHAQVFKASAGANPSCGDAATACATLDLKRVPSHLQATIGQSETAPASAGAPVDHHTVIDVASNAPVGAKPDLILDAVVGLPSTTPLVGSVPVRAHAELLGLPRYVTAHMDEHVTNPGLANEQRDLQKVSVRTCQVNVSDACVAGTEDALDTLSLEVQNFLVRPLDFPAPNHGITSPLWATVAGRAKLFQAAIELLNIREATYVNHQSLGTKGFRVKVGSNQDLQTRVDIKDLPLGSISLGDLAIDNARADVLANLLIHPLPDDIRICLRESGRPVGTPSGDVITAPCEDREPFGGTVGVPAHTPLSFAYRASVPIDKIRVDADAALNGNYNAVAGNPPIEARRLHGEFEMDHIPDSITAHILTPADDANGNAVGATRVHYDAPSTGPGINIHFRAHQTQGDSVCQDPRPSATALCVGADLINLPKHMTLRYEPDKLSKNFHAETDSDFNGKMDFKNLELSSVKPKVDSVTGMRVPGQAVVLVATGEIVGIDDHISVDGNINMPHDPNKAGAIDLTANISIDRIDAIVKNYIAPDPFTDAIPSRPVYKDPTSASKLDNFTVQAAPLPDGRPEFKATADIHNVKGFGFHQVSAADGTPIGTNIVNVNFGEDFAVRAYADIVTADAAHVTADALLEHIPAGLQFCFRGAKKDTTPAPAVGQPMTMCDDETIAAKKDGAFQFLGDPSDPTHTGIDVDAFVRAAAPGGTDIVSGRLNIDRIPYRIDGILPSEHNGGRLDVAAKDHLGAPLGIKQIRFNAASFDLPSGSGDLNSGYSSATPGFVPLTNQTAPFPPPTSSNQYVSAIAAGDPAGSFDFQAVGRLGGLTGSVSQLQRIFSGSDPCTKPTYSDAGARPDYPLFPLADGVSTYRCIGANLVQTDVNTPDPLDLNVKYLAADGTLAQLRNAGINDIPGWFQVDIAKTTDKEGTNDALRRRCGSIDNEANHGSAENAAKIAAYNPAHSTPGHPSTLTNEQIAPLVVVDCMPPLIRFDQPLDSARLFGVGEIGKPDGLAQLSTTNPQEALANLNTIPRGDGWDNPNDDGDTQKGIRAKALTLADGGTAARVNFRLPIPQSVTVDQVSTAKGEGHVDDAHYFNGSDFRFHYVVRDNAGVAVPSLGELSALYQSADGTQILVGAPCALHPDARVKNNSFGTFDITHPYSCDNDYRHGVAIPGEIGISMYTRDNLGTGQKYIQVDGRLSKKVDAALRLLGSAGGKVGRVEAELKNAPGPLDKNNNPDPSVGPDDATFRLEFLQKGDPQHVPGPPPSTPPAPPAPPEDCVFCVTSNIRLAQAFVGFDFHPTASDAIARRVEATLKQDGAKNGLELSAWDQVKDGSKTPVGADAYLLLDPLDVSAFLNLAPTLEGIADDIADAIVDSLDLPDWVGDIIGGVLGAIADLIASLVHADFTLESRLDASVHMHTRHMTLRQNILHVKVVNVQHDPTDDVEVGPFDLYIHQLKANANFGITIHTPWPFPDINIGLTLLTIYFLPAASDIVPFLIKYLDCAPRNFFDIVEELLPGLPGEHIHAQGANDANVVIWPLGDHRLILGGIIGDLINATTSIIPFGRNLAGLFFCIPGVGDSDIPLGAPGDSFNVPAGLLWPQHQIFDTDHLADSALGAGAPTGIPAPVPDPAPPVVPPPPPPAPTSNGPNYTVNAGTLALCGIHNYGVLTINSGATLAVATATDSATPTGDGANCGLATDVNRLVIKADRIVNHGIIDGAAKQSVPFTPPALAGACAGPAYAGPDGNGGGGHGGVGGKGGTGTKGGDAYANLCTDATNGQRNGSVSEIGAPGAGSGAGGRGGALVVLLANDDVTSDGAILADGEDGVGDTSGACAFNTVTDNPPAGAGPEDTTVHHANTGLAAPRGGGAGGGIVVSAGVIDLRGTTPAEFHANGGNGQDSKKAPSGGGGGGIVKLLGPVQLYDPGFSAGTSAGSAGTNTCQGLDQPTFEGTTASGGTGGTLIQIANPTAQAAAVSTFWNKGLNVTVPFRASGALQSIGGFTTVLCARFTSTTSLSPPNTDLRDLFAAPATSSPGNPCGGADTLGNSHPAVKSVKPGDAGASITFSRTGAANSGLWGVWAVTLRPPAGTSQDCLSNSFGCVASPAPAKVDQVFGIDNINPTVSISDPLANFLTKSPSVGLSFAPDDPNNGAGKKLSGVKTTECRNAQAGQETPFVACSSGSSFNLVPGNGPKTIAVRVTDVAGNSSIATVSGILSNSPPTANAAIEFVPNGSNGWYTNKLSPFSAPKITISGYNQGDGVPAEVSTNSDTGPYRYRFDNLPEKVCTASPCVVPASEFAALPAGTHTFHWTAIDKLGNRLFGTGMQALSPFKWDPDRPTTQLDTVPLTEDVTLSGVDWFTTKPFVVLSGLDKLGGAGLDKTYISLDGGPFTVFNVNNLTPLADGNHTVDYYSTDLAGNVEPTKTRVNIRVDSSAPDSTLNVSGGVLGLAGWYTTAPNVTVGGFDDHGGTGAPASRALTYRVDNGNDVFCNATCNVSPSLLKTGTHLIGRRAADAGGNESSETGQIVKVDTQAPLTTISMRSPKPDGLNSWYKSLPYVVLSATDQAADLDHVLPVGSGVAKSEFQLDGGGWVLYTGPFQVAGQHSLCVRSTDVAGNVETPLCLPAVKGDDADPTTAIAVAGTLGGAGWYTSPATVTVTSADPVPGSGLVEPGSVGSPCYDVPGGHPAAGTCVSIDGRKFAAYSVPITLNEGVHTVQAYSVDAAGRRSIADARTVVIDQSAPVTTARALPPYSARNGWYRAVPRIVLRATDGDQNSGVQTTFYKIDSAPFVTYNGPFDVPNGHHVVSYFSKDNAGLIEPTRTLNVDVDTTPPVAIATTPEPAIWLQILSVLGNILGLSPANAKLHWTIGDQYSGKLSVRVIIFDETGNVVRQLDGGSADDNSQVCNPICTVAPSTALKGYTLWDGKDKSLTGLVGVGIYYYRVIVIDDAGNVAQSQEAKPVQIKASLGIL